MPPFLGILTSQKTLHPSLVICPGEGSGNPLQYSCQDNSVDRGVWWATVHGVTKSWTWLSTHALVVCQRLPNRSAARDAQKNMSRSANAPASQNPESVWPQPPPTPPLPHSLNEAPTLPSCSCPQAPPGKCLPLAHDVAIEGVEDALVRQLQGVVQDLHVPATLHLRRVPHLHGCGELLFPHLQPTQRLSPPRLFHLTFCTSAQSFDILKFSNL